MDVLDNATLWVGISFLIFVLLIFKPLLNSISASLDKKIDSIKDNITEAKELKEEAEKIFILHEEKQKNIRSDIKKLLDDAKNESKHIESTIKKSIEVTLKRKEGMHNQKVEQDRLKFQNEISKKILKTAIEVTQVRIVKNLSESKNNLLIKKSLKNIKVKLNRQ